MFISNLHKEAVHAMECWLTGEFSRFPNLPTIRVDHPFSHDIFLEDPIYRAMMDYLFHWVLNSQQCHLQRSEIQSVLLKVARRYGKVFEIKSKSRHCPIDISGKYPEKIQ